MAVVCPTSIHVVRSRFTRLVAVTGDVAPAPNNHVVTDSIISIGVAPDVIEGENKEVVGGGDCICASYKGPNRLLRFNLTVQFCRLEPALIEILTGASLFTNGTAEPIGNVWPISQGCGQTQPPVAAEFWSDNWSGDAQSASPNQYTRWVFPRSYWQWDDFTLENEFMLPQFVGWSQSNTAWGDEYGDLPTGVTTPGGASGQGGYFFDDSMPNAICGYSGYST